MQFSVGCEIGYEIVQPATLIFNVTAIRSRRQNVISEQLTFTPSLASDETVALESGNRYQRLTVGPGPLTVAYSATVALDPVRAQPDSVAEVPIARLPLETLPYLNPSRYCPSDQLARFAQRQFGGIAPGFSRVSEICSWIHHEVDYLFGTSDSTTTAADTFALRAGVCRDFAHLGITFCRALGIPARFVSCYAWQLEPQDFHAVFEAYLGDRWYLFDPTRMAALDGMVRIGCGRDAADTAFATIYGVVNPQPIRVWSEAINGNTQLEWTTDAISLSGD